MLREGTRGNSRPRADRDDHAKRDAPGKVCGMTSANAVPVLFDDPGASLPKKNDDALDGAVQEPGAIQ